MISPLMNKNLKVLRSQPGQYIDGIYQQGERIELTVQGTAQPIKQRQSPQVYDPSLLGKDIKGLICIYTVEPLISIDNQSMIMPDIIVYENKMYQVITDDTKRSLLNLSHYKYTAEYIESIEDSSGETITGDPFRPNKIKISENGIMQGLQNELNFILGNGLSLDVVNDDTNGKVDITISNTATGAGGQSLTEVVAKENLTAFKVVTSDGYQADSNNIFHKNKILGLIIANINQGFSGNVAYIGPVSNPAWYFVIGSEIFLNGTELSTIPPESGFIQSIGTATKTDTINIDLKDSILL